MKAEGISIPIAKDFRNRRHFCRRRRSRPHSGLWITEKGAREFQEIGTNLQSPAIEQLRRRKFWQRTIKNCMWLPALLALWGSRMENEVAKAFANNNAACR